MFDSQVWGFDRQASYIERQSHLIAAAAAAPDNKRLAPRLDLARFYLARDMYPEAKGVLDVALADDRPAAEGVSAVVLRAVAEVMMNRPDDALKDLADPGVGDQHDAPLWRALAYARQGNWAQARDRLQDRGGGGGDAADRAAARRAQGRNALRDRGRRFRRRVRPTSTISRPSASRTTWSRRSPFSWAGSPRAWAATRTRSPPIARPRIRGIGRRRRKACLRETVLRYQLGDLKRDDVISELEIADHDLARRRDRDRGAESPGASLHRGRPLSRRLLCHAQRHGGASGFRT